MLVPVRIPLTPLGTREILLFGVVPLALGIVLVMTVHWAAAIVPFALAVFVFSFFRDPTRSVPQEPGLLVSPADGVVNNILEVDEPLYLKGRGRRVGIFLSVFNVHVNRSPGAGVVEFVHYTPGKFLNAELDKASEDNERNGVVLDTPYGQVAVVRIAGLVARRIVCWIAEADTLSAGERIGMIRFGSRLDVYLPQDAIVRVAKGQQAVAGETVIARFGAAGADRQVRID